MSDLPAGLRVQKVGELVELSGRITLAEGADDWILLFTLPEEYRPGGIVPCGVESEGGALELWIEPDGSVLADSPRPGWIELDGINYPAGDRSVRLSGVKSEDCASVRKCPPTRRATCYT